MPKILSGFLILVMGGVMGWLALRNAGSYAGQLPKGLAEVSQYQGQLVRLRQALADYQAENGPLTFTDGRELVAVLAGKNVRSKVYLEAPPLRFDQAGEPMDPWGREIRFKLREGRVVAVEEKAL